MRTQLVLFAAGGLGVVSTALGNASVWVIERQRALLRAYFSAPEPVRPRAAERAN